jgi:hypothetical protein
MNLLKRAEIIAITCLNMNYPLSYTMKNTRGIELSPSDLIKSNLYGNLNDDLNNAVYSNLARNRNSFLSKWKTIPDLLTYYEYYILAQNPTNAI